MAKLNKDQKKELWSRRVTAGLKYRHETHAKHWDTLLQFLLGDQWNEEDEGYHTLNHHAVYNVCWQIVRTYVPSLYLDDPYFIVRANAHPNQPADDLQEKEKWWQSRINRQWQKTKARKEVRDCITDSIIFGYGCAKTGWYLVPQDTQDAYSQGDRMENLSGYIRRVSPREVVLDPLATSIRDARWIAWTYTRPYLDVMGDSRYKKHHGVLEPTLYAADLAAGMKSASGGLRVMEEGGGSPDLDDAILEREGYIRFWEIMTFEEGGQMLTFTEAGRDPSLADGPGVEKHSHEMEHLLRDEERPYQYLDWFPYHFLTFNDVPDVLYGPSDMEMIKDLQKQLNLLRSMQIDQAAGQKTIYLADQQVVDENVAEKIQEAADHEMVGVDLGGNKILQEVFMPMQRVPMSQDAYIAQEQLKSDVYTQSGADQAARNASMEDETATAVMTRHQYSNIRMTDRTLIMKGWLEDLCLSFSRILKNEDEEEQAYPVEIEESGGQRRQIIYTIGDLDDNYRIVMEPANTFPLHREMEISQFLSAVNLMGNNPHVDMRELAIRTFEMFHVRNVDRIVPAMNIPPEIIMLLQNNPQFFQMVMQAGAQIIQAMEAEQQGQGGGGGGGGGRQTMDPNQLQQVEGEMNAANASAMQGGTGRNF